jgi:hypothetical protein
MFPIYFELEIILSEKKPFIKFYENNLDELMKQKWFHGNLEDKPKDKIC